MSVRHPENRVPASKWFILNSTLSLQYVYELLYFYLNSKGPSSHQIPSRKRPALSAKRVQIYAPYFLTAKLFPIFFLKKNELIYKCLFFRFPFFLLNIFYEKKFQTSPNLITKSRYG